MGASGLVLPRVRGRVGYSCVAEYWVSLLLMGGRVPWGQGSLGSEPRADSD